jgi:hypothetical protein
MSSISSSLLGYSNRFASSKLLLPPFQIIGHFSFLSQTYLTLIKFLGKHIDLVQKTALSRHSMEKLTKLI